MSTKDEAPASLTEEQMADLFRVLSTRLADFVETISNEIAREKACHVSDVDYVLAQVMITLVTGFYHAAGLPLEVLIEQVRIAWKINAKARARAGTDDTHH
jgi:hypothetical protein